MEHPAKVLASLGIFPKKGLGQNFLADGNIARKIVDMISEEGGWIVEVGPGLGALTILLQERGKPVKAVEIDSSLALYLKEHVREKTVDIVEGDFLKLDGEIFAAWSRKAGTGLTIVGNLPYSISGPLLFRFIELRQNISRCFVMLQREVATRITSPPGGKNYGAISVILQAVGRVKILFSVSRNSFYPVPEVDSSFVEIDFVSAPPAGINDFETFRDLVNAAFSSRRKVIKNALFRHFRSKGMEGKEDQEELIRKAGIWPGDRPERISVQQFVSLANLMGQETKGKGS